MRENNAMRRNNCIHRMAYTFEIIPTSNKSSGPEIYKNKAKQTLVNIGRGVIKATTQIIHNIRRIQGVLLL